MATVEDEQRGPAADAAPARRADRARRGRAAGRRSLLTWLSVGAGSALVAAGTGAGIRGAVNGAFTAGSGAPYAMWQDWATLSGVDRVVAAGVLACNPHNTQPWRIGVGGDGVVTVDDALDRVAQVTGGRLLARLHLKATALGLGFHHMNQVTERIDRDRAAGRADVFSTRWADVLGVPASTGLVSFRIGHPERPAGLSPRRPLSEITT